MNNRHTKNSVISHEVDAHQNHNGIQFHTHYNSYNQKNGQ